MKIASPFVLVDDGAGADVTPAVLTSIAVAVQEQIALHFAPVWGWQGVSVTVGDFKPGDVGIPVYVRVSSDVPGAAGYHDDSGVYVFRDGLPSLTTGSESLSVVISHEILETLGDPGANRWGDAGGGTEYAIELCDAVEGFSYEIAGVAVSDFLLPSFFDPEGIAPFSYMAKPTAPFTTAPDGGGNYQIVRTVNEQGVQQVTAATAPRRARLWAKRHPKSRTSKRGARV